MLREVGTGLNNSDGSPDDDRDASSHMNNDPMAERVARLTDGQLDCLRLVDQHLNSKEIAAELGISENTVEQHLAKGMRLCSAALADSPVAERRSPWFDRSRRRSQKTS